MKTIFLLAALSFATGLQAATISASASFTDVQFAPGDYQYDITLDNTGTTTIGTFWFAWVLGAGFMSATPTSIVSPTGWTETLTNGNASIQWKTTSSLLAEGQTLTGFEFDSTLSPTDLEAAFPGPGTGTGDPVATSFVYIAAPLGDPGSQLVVSDASPSAPEPGTLLLTGLGIALLAWRKYRTV